MVGPCPCGTYHSHGHQCCSATALGWPAPPETFHSQYSSSYEVDEYSSYSYSSPFVDCTLSLGTPSTRRSSNPEPQDRRSSVQDFHHQTNHSKAPGSSSRQCANCDTTSTPLWRNGPRGPKSLCNACGIRYKKEERRRASAAASSANATVSTDMDAAENYQYFSPAAMGSEYGYMDDVDGQDSDSGIQFVSWPFNVAGQDYQPCP